MSNSVPDPLSPADAGNDRPTDGPVAALIYFSGPQRGKIVRLVGDDYVIERDDSNVVSASDSQNVRAATLDRSGDTYEIVSRDDSRLFVNGMAAQNTTLCSEDLIEVSTGTVFRYRLFHNDEHTTKSLREILTDCADFARRDQRSAWRVIPTVMVEGVREILTQTSRWFRAGVIASFVLVALALGLNYWYSWQLTERQAQDQVRLDALETAAVSAGNVIARASPSVVFLQGAFGYREPTTGRRLRYMPGPTGEPIRLPNGLPALTMNERGVVLEVDFSGTAFVIGPRGLLITNRHVAVPWENQPDPFTAMITENGLSGFLVRLHGYMPGAQEPVEVQMVHASDDSDLALLRGTGETTDQVELPMAVQVPAPGEPVILLGYPAGIRALMARAPTPLRERLSGRNIKPAQVARELARSGLIQPLASRGIVGQISQSAIVYDAETTSGGSGGPLLNERGEVVAINMAILPEFGGSNLGVPVAHAVRLLRWFNASQLTPQDQEIVSDPLLPSARVEGDG